MKLLFMDEKYAVQDHPPEFRVTSLTGVLIPQPVYREFRGRFYGLVAAAIDDPENTISTWPHEQLHAQDLLPAAASDDQRFSFLTGLVSLVNELDLRIYRIGYFATPQVVSFFNDGERGLVATCFIGMLNVLKEETADAQVWPVMEIDHSDGQDQSFAGSVQASDYAFSRFDSQEGFWVSNANFGEVLYMTKRSGCGALVDNVAYLLHEKWLRSVGHHQTPYKERLGEIASGFTTIACDDVVTLSVPDSSGRKRYSVKRP